MMHLLSLNFRFHSLLQKAVRPLPVFGITPIAHSSSINAVNFSSACTTKRWPSSRCASTIQIVRPSRSTDATHPPLHSALLRLSAMISQYFIGVQVDDES